MKIHKSILIFLVCLLIFLPSVLAQPPFTQTNININQGFSIEFPKLSYFEPTKDLVLNFHIYNRTLGEPILNSLASCSFHLFNQEGEHVVENTSIARNKNLLDYFVEINSTDIMEIGRYSYIIACNTTSTGGFSSVGIEVTHNGQEPFQDNTGFGIILLSLVTLVGLCFSLALLLGEDKTYSKPLKVLLVWFGATLINGIFFIIKLIADSYNTGAFSRIGISLFVGYSAVYIIFTWFMFILFFKEVIWFFRDVIRNDDVIEGEGGLGGTDPL